MKLSKDCRKYIDLVCKLTDQTPGEVVESAIWTIAQINEMPEKDQERFYLLLNELLGESQLNSEIDD